MSMNVAEKLKIMRESERLTSLPEAAKMLGLNRDALWRYEAGKTIPNTEVIMSILNHPRFEKYALWFITGKIAPESGQIAPALALWARRNNVSALRPENWLSIFLAYLYENHRVTICYVTPDRVFTRGDSYDR